MTVTPYLFRQETPQALETEFNTVFATLLNERVLGSESDVVRTMPAASKNLYIAITTDTSGASVITNPYRLKTFVASTDMDAKQLADDYMAANPTYFFSPVFALYRPTVYNPNESTIIGVIYNVSFADGNNNWGYVPTGAAPTGPASGDLDGNYPNPTVVGFDGVPLSAPATVSGEQYIYNATSGQWEPVQPVRYFASGAAAQAAAPFINNTTVVISPGSPTSEAGTYQVTSNGGIAFPADYTKVSDVSDTASEVSVVDAGNYFGSSNLEGVTQEIGAGAILPLTGALPIGATVMDTRPIASYGSVEWVVEVVNGNLRYHAHLAVAHDDSTATLQEFGGVVSPGIGVLPITFDADVSGGNVRVIATVSAGGWSYRIRCLDALAV